MADEQFPQENELEGRQGDLYPVGRVLRRTYDAENHDSLGTDLTGLMLELARIETDAPVPGRGAMPLPVAPAAPTVVAPAPAAPPSASWWRSAIDRLLG